MAAIVYSNEEYAIDTEKLRMRYLDYFDKYNFTTDPAKHD